MVTAEEIAAIPLFAGIGPEACERLSRAAAEVDAYVADPLCFQSLQSASMVSFLGAARRLSDPYEIRNVHQGLPVYIFSGGDDPVGGRRDRTLLEHQPKKTSAVS